MFSKNAKNNNLECKMKMNGPLGKPYEDAQTGTLYEIHLLQASF